MRSPFFIEIYDKAMKRVGFIGDPAEIKVTPRHGAVGEASFTIRNDHTRAPLLMAAGARVRITYAGVDSVGAPWTERLISGPVRGVGGNGVARTLTFRVDDDARLLGRVLGWPAPTQPITNQGATSAYRTITGPAESVLKSFVTENAVTRLGLPVVCATNQNRGATITVKMRMHPLADRLLPAVLQAGVGFTVDQQLVAGVPKLVVDCYTPTTYPRSLTEASGVVTSYDYDLNAPTVTRGVVGAQGEGTAREFSLFPATRPSALEAEWGDVVEVFRDARDTADLTELVQRGAESLAEGAPTSAIRATLTESGIFRYGGPGGVHVGDKVVIEAGGIEVANTITEATLSMTPNDGVTVDFTVGELDDPLTLMRKALIAAHRRIRDLSVSR